MSFKAGDICVLTKDDYSLVRMGYKTIQVTRDDDNGPLIWFKWLYCDKYEFTKTREYCSEREYVHHDKNKIVTNILNDL